MQVILSTIHSVSDKTKQTNIAFIGLYLVLEYIEWLVSSVCYYFSYFDMPIICRPLFCNLLVTYMTFYETNVRFIFESF